MVFLAEYPEIATHTPKHAGVKAKVRDVSKVQDLEIFF